MGNVKTINGLARANVKTRNGLASANVKTINGVDAEDAVGPFGGLVDVTNLVEWWPLSESSGSRTGSHIGVVMADNNTVTGGNDGVAYSQFTATNSEYLSTADTPALSHGNFDFTWTMWVYLDSKTAQRYFIFKGANTAAFSAWEFFVQYNSSLDRFRCFPSDGTGGTGLNADNFGSPSTSTWYFIVAWHDATANTINIQVNDGTADSASHTTGSFDSTHGLEFGRAGTSLNYHNGRMRRVGFWKQILTAGEKTALYNSGGGLDY